MRNFSTITNKTVRSLSFRIASVPEQVNIPLQICRESQLVEKYVTDLKKSSEKLSELEINIDYVSVPEGTGRMMDMLESEEIDLALTVTDAFISNKAKSTSSKSVKSVLCGTYVCSPLIWALCGAGSLPGVSQNVNEKLTKGEPIKYGISRLGSGSHTMAFYTNYIKGSKTINLLPEFVIANNFQQLREGLNGRDFDMFLWEKFTTKPWFDSGELTLIGEVSAPWPAFSFATSIYNSCDPQSLSLIECKEQLIQQCVFPAIQDAIQEFISPIHREASLQRIVSQFKHTKEDAALWMDSCRYASTADMRVNQADLEQSISILKEMSLVPISFSVDQLLHPIEKKNSMIVLA